MTTDPRVIECAKAMLDTGVLTRPEKAVLFPDDYETLARACILKWLEQEPTQSMSMSDAAKVEGGEHRFIGFGKAAEVYTAMNAQAAKEIAE